jgi:hypothetical protein
MSEKPRGSDRSKGAPWENGSETVEGSAGLLRRGRERGAGVTLVSSSVLGGAFLWKALFAIIPDLRLPAYTFEPWTKGSQRLIGNRVVTMAAGNRSRGDQPTGRAPRPCQTGGNANELSENSAHDSKTLQQLLPKFHRQCRVVAAQHFPALLWRHTGELPQEVIPRLVFGIAAPTDPDRQQSRRHPNSYVPLLDHALR